MRSLTPSRGAVWLALIVWCAAAHASAITWLNYTDFDTRLGELAADVGITAFSADETTTIRGNIASQLALIYSAYDIAFTEAQPGAGDYHRMVMGATTGTAGLLGQAARLDWRNLNANDSADIYTRNYGFFIETGDARADMITELSMGLAGSTAHELGHNLGLFHEDSYGTRGITPDNYANTGGLQNQHIMATGSTGLTELQREAQRYFNTLELSKLYFGEGLTSSTPTSLAEQGSAHSTPGTAQGLSFTSLPLPSIDGANLTGAISAVGENDYYSFGGVAAQRLTLQAMSWSLDRLADYVDPYVYLYDTDGSTLLWSADDTFWQNNVFNSGNYSHSVSYDPLILNFELPHDGTYYLRVTAPWEPLNTGDYELLTVLDSYDVPEPVGSGLFACGLVVLILRRRRA